MYKTLLSTPRWKVSSHICLACRHQMLLVAIDSRRHTSTSSTDAVVVDGWINNFNDLSAEQDSKSNTPSRLSKPGKSPARSHRLRRQMKGASEDGQTTDDTSVKDGSSANIARAKSNPNYGVKHLSIRSTGAQDVESGVRRSTPDHSVHEVRRNGSRTDSNSSPSSGKNSGGQTSPLQEHAAVMDNGPGSVKESAPEQPKGIDVEEKSSIPGDTGNDKGRREQQQQRRRRRDSRMRKAAKRRELKLQDAAEDKILDGTSAAKLGLSSSNPALDTIEVAGTQVDGIVTQGGNDPATLQKIVEQSGGVKHEAHAEFANLESEPDNPIHQQSSPTDVTISSASPSASASRKSSGRLSGWLSNAQEALNLLSTRRTSQEEKADVTVREAAAKETSSRDVRKSDKHDAVSTKNKRNRPAQSPSKEKSNGEGAVAPRLQGVLSSDISGQTSNVHAEPNEQSATQEPVIASQHTTYSAINSWELEVTPLNIDQPPVPSLSYGLDRVLFNPGVYQLQDPHSRVYNFDPYLQNIMPVHEFDFNALKEYKTSSQDSVLSSLARDHEKKYVGSTSSMTGILGQFHYLLSDWRGINVDMLSREFPIRLTSFTQINRAPSAIFLRWQNGAYAIDADKEFDTPNVLMMLGKSMEKLLTLPKDEYERYRKSDSRRVPDEEREAPEAYEYTSMGDFLMRSQLDAYDSRLPGNGTFDLKTRSVVSIRMDAANFEPMLGYELHTLQGEYESYEREYFDMLRSTMLKYMLQARMGRMDGIFLAYHNIQRIFGFQYLPMYEIDRAIHGQVNSCLGDQEFKASLRMLNEILNIATTKFPERSVRMHYEVTPASDKSPAGLLVFAEPMDEDNIERIQSSTKAKIAEFERTMMGIEKEAEIEASKPESQTLSQYFANASSANDTGAFTTSESNADTNFIDDVESQRFQPLFAALIVVDSKVNGEPVARPVNLKPEDRWTVEYSIKEFTDLDYMWSLYAQVKARRKKILSKSDGDDSADDESKNNYFIRMLREFAAKGRDFRTKMNRLEEGKTPVVYGDALSSAGSRKD